ncbi:hypothetical protein BC829DRAFT_401997 [Chytridium lagenaria]|nr:hypothetical protein BC829DRAFT_401997 [Chytridium lagenaria]
MFELQTIDEECAELAAHPTLPFFSYRKGNGEVIVYSNGDHSPTKTVYRKDFCSSRVVWHPTKAFLAVGWETGLVTILSDVESNWREGILHQYRITTVEWNASGNRLVTADEEGEVVVWKVDSKGKMSSLCQYRLKGAISWCIIKRVAELPDQRFDDMRI